MRPDSEILRVKCCLDKRHLSKWLSLNKIALNREASTSLGRTFCRGGI